MAIYHCSVKVISRGKGQSAIAKAAYNARDRLTDEQTGEVRNYSRKASEVVFSGIFAPEHAPEWARNREQLWNQVEAAEKRKDAQLAREMVVALPHELTDQQRQWLVTDFVRENFQRAGMVADVNIHAADQAGDGRNHHAHILLTMREIGAEGFGAKVREWNSRGQLESWRATWEKMANHSLERFGHASRIDHRSLEAQGIDRAPTTHKGKHIQEMEARGIVSHVQGRRAEEAANDNQARTLRLALRAELAAVSHEEASLDPRSATLELKDIDQEESRRQGHAATATDSASMVAQNAEANRRHLELNPFLRGNRGEAHREAGNAAAQLDRYMNDPDYRRQVDQQAQGNSLGRAPPGHDRER